MEWTLVDAKNRLSEVITRALSEGPQLVRRRDDAVVIVARREYEELAGKRPSFKSLLMKGPDFDDLDLERDRTSMRDVTL